MPRGFPNHGHSRSRRHDFAWKSLSKIDIVGAMLLLGGSIFLVSALQEAANGSAWSPSMVISLLVLSGPLWISCFFWEWYITPAEKIPEPVLPWRFVTNRVPTGLLL